MARRYEEDYEENSVDSYEEAMERMNRIFNGDEVDEVEVLPTNAPIEPFGGLSEQDQDVQLVEVKRQTENEVIGIRVMTRGKDEDATKALHHAHNVIDETMESAQETIDSAEDAADRIEKAGDASVSTESSFEDRFSDILDQENPESEFSIKIGGKPQSMLNEDMHEAPTVDANVNTDVDFHIPTEAELEEQANAAYLDLLQHPPHVSEEEIVEDSIEERIVEDLSADAEVPDTLPDPETISDVYTDADNDEAVEETTDVAVVDETPEVLDIVKPSHETIVHEDTVHVTPDMLKDGVTIQNTVTITTDAHDESDVEKMRQMLAEDMNTNDSAQRAEELAKDYSHLEDENDDPHMRRRGKDQ